MARKRASRLPTALIKAFLPTPAKRKRARRKKSPAISLPKIAVSPAVRKSAVRATSARSTAPKKSSARRSSGRKPPTLSTTGKGTWRQARFTGAAGTRSYRVYIPLGLRKTSKVALVLALHGCGQDGPDFAAGTRFNDVADTHKFIVVYPEQSMTHNGQRCWNWFRTGHQFRASGEPAILAGIVRRVILETSSWRVDPERVYVTGISAGGAMAVVLAATYPELFAAVGVHSAPPYRSASGPANALAAMQGRATAPPVEVTAAAPMPPMIIFQGTFDGTVRPVNAQRIADQWLAFRANDGSRLGIPAGAVAGRSEDPVGKPRTSTTSPARPTSARSRRGYTVSRWYSGGRKVLELWIVDGLGHAWSGGSVKGSYSDARGPRATTEMWKFFSAHRLPAAAGTAAIRAG